MTSRPIAILCNPQGTRASEHAKALQGMGLPAPILIAYGDLLEGVDLSAALPGGCMLRIESFGEDWGVERRLIAKGVGDAGSRAHAEALALQEDYGRYRYQAALRRGAEALFREVEDVLTARDDVRVLNAPREVLAMSDKLACRSLLRAHDVPMPDALTETGGVDVMAPTQLHSAMTSAGWSQVFVKPRYGSSAAGVIAVRRSEQRVVAYSSLEAVEVDGEMALYNSLRVSRVEGLAVDRLLAPILGEGAVIERWIPKRAHPDSGQPMDVRIVCIAGRPMHAVIRTSKGPITNLHLGNDRADFDRFAAGSPAAAACIRDAAGLAAGAFPASLTVSVDVLLEARSDRAAVLEVNAFGELLHGVTCDGLKPYEALWRAACTP